MILVSPGATIRFNRTALLKFPFCAIILDMCHKESISKFAIRFECN